MLYSSLAILAVTASSAIPPFGNLIHLHPHTQPDNRVEVTLVNHATTFRDVKVAGHTYTVSAGSAIAVKAPAGTIVYRDSFAPYHVKGEVLIAMTPAMNDQVVEVK